MFKIQIEEVLRTSISFQINLLEENLSISFTFTALYPKEKLLFSINSTKYNSKQIEMLTELCESFVKEKKNECVYDLIEFIKENIPKEIEKIEKIKITEYNPNVLIGVHFHHIYAESKKREILNGKSIFKLNGIYKFGKPGRLLVYGDKHSVDQYISRLKGLTWQEIKVRFEYELELNETFKDFIGVSSDNQLANELKEMKLDDYFYELIGMNKS
jgi:hypothetical protein